MAAADDATAKPLNTLNKNWKHKEEASHTLECTLQHDIEVLWNENQMHNGKPNASLQKEVRNFAAPTTKSALSS